MADENENGATGELLATETPIEAPAPKKQRAPRRSKAEMAAASTAKSPKVSKKRAVKTEAVPAPAETAVAKATAKGRTKSSSPIVVPAATSVAASDDMADLVQLEQENKQLRLALAEKLRAENADLRKRLDA